MPPRSTITSPPPPPHTKVLGTRSWVRAYIYIYTVSEGICPVNPARTHPVYNHTRIESVQEGRSWNSPRCLLLSALLAEGPLLGAGSHIFFAFVALVHSKLLGSFCTGLHLCWNFGALVQLGVSSRRPQALPARPPDLKPQSWCSGVTAILQIKGLRRLARGCCRRQRDPRPLSQA